MVRDVVTLLGGHLGLRACCAVVGDVGDEADEVLVIGSSGKGAVHLVDCLLRRHKLAQRPQDHQVVVVGLSAGIQLHQEHISERGAENEQVWVVQERLACPPFECRGFERRGAVVEPHRREAVTGGDLRDRGGEFGVEMEDGVDIDRGVAQTMPGEQRSADNDNDVPRRLLGNASATSAIRATICCRFSGVSDTDGLSISPKAALIDREATVKQLARCAGLLFCAHPRRSRHRPVRLKFRRGPRPSGSR
jgi:hypothetical protein